MVAELNDYISIRKAAKECGRSAETVRRWVWDGKLKARKLGNQLYIKKAELTFFCGNKKIKLIDSFAALEKAWQINASIRRRIGGNIDIIEALDGSRESHP